jgi:hypothetical protein
MMGNRKAFGFILALCLGLAFPLAVRVAFAAVEGIDLFWMFSEDWPGLALNVAIAAVPFVVLAHRGVRAWQTWLTGIAITAIIWGYYLHEVLTYRGGGADIGLGLIMLVSPLAVLGGALWVHARMYKSELLPNDR